MIAIEVCINWGSTLGELTTTHEFETMEDMDKMLNIFARKLNPRGITWCYCEVEDSATGFAAWQAQQDGGVQE